MSEKYGPKFAGVLKSKGSREHLAAPDIQRVQHVADPGPARGSLRPVRRQMTQSVGSD